MSLIFTDTSNVTFYTFPADFDLHSWNDRDFSTRSKILDRFAVHGGRQVGDMGIESRTVKLGGEYYAATASALESFLDDLAAALHNNGEEYRFSWYAGEYIGVSLCKSYSAKRKTKGLAYTAVEIDIELLCPDPFWYSVSDDSAGAVSISADPTDITITSNSNVPSPLRIQADPTASWAEMTVTNVTDSSNLLIYADPTFVSGEQLVIDSRYGTVEKDGLNTIRYLSGAFLRVLPGANTIRISGVTGGTVTLSAPRRFL